MDEKGILLIISGPSGAGKGTVVENLIKNGEYSLSISATTRKPRPYEQDGIHYFFKDKDDFDKMIEGGELLENACFCGNYYGTPKEYVKEQIDKGVNIILEIEVQGALQVKELYPEAVLIFLAPPSIGELEKRLVGRGTEDIRVVQKRIERAVEEMEYVCRYDYIVINDFVESAAKKIIDITSAEKARVFRNLEFYKTFKGEI